MKVAPAPKPRSRSVKGRSIFDEPPRPYGKVFRAVCRQYARHVDQIIPHKPGVQQVVGFGLPPELARKSQG
jgi:hypothetical protein